MALQQRINYSIYEIQTWLHIRSTYLKTKKLENNFQDNPLNACDDAKIIFHPYSSIY